MRVAESSDSRSRLASNSHSLSAALIYGAPFVSKLFLAVDYLLLYKLELLFRLRTSNLMFFGKVGRQYS